MSKKQMCNKYEKHYYLHDYYKKKFKPLAGRVMLLVFFVNDKKSKWNEKSLKQYKKQQEKALKRLEKHAQKNGVALGINHIIHKIDVDEIIDRNNTYYIVRKMFSVYKCDNKMDFMQECSEKYNFDTLRTLFVFNKTDISYASCPFKQAMIFKDDKCFSARTIQHELLHLFGAKDLYVPSFTKLIASVALKKSIMNDGNRLDDLTKFLIGWKKDISNDMLFFLETTKSTDGKVVEEERKKLRR